MSAAVSMRVDERGLSSEELDDRLDLFGPTEELDEDDEEQEPAPQPPCGLCDGIATEGDRLCARCRGEEIAREAREKAPCVRCGAASRPRNRRGGGGGLCEACVRAEEQEKRDREFAERIARLDARAEEERLARVHRCVGEGCLELPSASRDSGATSAWRSSAKSASGAAMFTVS